MARLTAAKAALSTCVGPERVLLSKTQADAVVQLAGQAQVWLADQCGQSAHW